MFANRPDNIYPGEAQWPPRPLHLAPNRSAAEGRHLIKRQYVFLIVACLVAAHTIFYSTSVLLTHLPDATLRLPPKATALAPAHPSARHTATTTTSSSSTARATPPTLPPPANNLICNETASPYSLAIRGQRHFPELSAFLRANTLLMEDVHPAAFWVVTRIYNKDNKLRSLIDWGLVPPGTSALLPLPRGIMPLFTPAPVSVNCSWAQVRHQWAAAHPDDGCPLQLRPDLRGVSLSGTVSLGMGHPQGLFFRVSLPHLLLPDQPAAGSAVQTQQKREMKKEKKKKRQQGPGPGQGPLVRPEHELFQADDRFSGGERLFQMRSMTKALVALLAMALQDRELLSVDDPVSEYLPEWGEGVYGNMTVRMLLSHTAGYDSAYADEHVLAPGDITLQESARRTLNHSRLVAAPGQRFQYTEIGFQVLGAVLEAAGGDSFQSLLEELVLVPAGLCSTRVFNWFVDTVPTHGPLIPDCRTDPPPPDSPAGGPEPSAAGSSSNRRMRGSGRSPSAMTISTTAAVAATRSGKDPGGGGAGAARWSTNPTIAVGGVTSASDLNRLLGLLANKGQATCGCGAAVAAPADPSPPDTRPDSAGKPLGTAGEGGSSSTGRRRGGWGGWGGRADAPPASPSSRSNRRKQQQQGEIAGRRYCECGTRVVSEAGVSAMLSRQPTPAINGSELVESFRRAGPLTADLLAGMGLVEQGVVSAWKDQMWGDIGYGFGAWLVRNPQTGDDHAWMYGAFNTVAGLLTLGERSRASRVAEQALGGTGRLRGGGGVEGSGERKVQVAVVGVSMSAFNVMWLLMTGYLAIQA